MNAATLRQFPVVLAIIALVKEWGLNLVATCVNKLVQKRYLENFGRYVMQVYFY